MSSDQSGRCRSLHNLVPCEYGRHQPPPNVSRWLILQGTSRHKWNQSDLFLPEGYRHTLNGHDVYLTALAQQGAGMREVIAEVHSFTLLTCQVAGREAADSLQDWLNETWAYLADLVGHRRRLLSCEDPEAVPLWLWEEHTRWMYFRWELLAPSDGAVAAMVAATLQLYAIPEFAWTPEPGRGQIKGLLALRKTATALREKPVLTVHTREGPCMTSRQGLRLTPAPPVMPTRRRAASPAGEEGELCEAMEALSVGPREEAAPSDHRYANHMAGRPLPPLPPVPATTSEPEYVTGSRRWALGGPRRSDRRHRHRHPAGQDPFGIRVRDTARSLAMTPLATSTEHLYTEPVYEEPQESAVGKGS